MTIAYDGSRYYGWEHQPGIELTVQGKIESVLNKMLKLKISLFLQLCKGTEILMALLRGIRVGGIIVLLKNMFIHTHRILTSCSPS